MHSCQATGTKKCRCGKNAMKQILSNDLRLTLRKVFSDHAVFTKFYLNSAMFGEPDSKVILKRLLENQVDIGETVEPIIGKDKSKKLIKLLTEHIKLAGNCVAKLMAGNKVKLTEAIEQLFANSKEVAQFLSSLNPTKLKYKDVKEMFDQHNKYVLQMATERSKKQWGKDIKTYDEYYNHMLMFSDILFNALV